MLEGAKLIGAGAATIALAGAAAGINPSEISKAIFRAKSKALKTYLKDFLSYQGALWARLLYLKGNLEVLVRERIFEGPNPLPEVSSKKLQLSKLPIVMGSVKLCEKVPAVEELGAMDALSPTVDAIQVNTAGTNKDFSSGKPLLFLFLFLGLLLMFLSNFWASGLISTVLLVIRTIALRLFENLFGGSAPALCAPPSLTPASNNITHVLLYRELSGRRLSPQETLTTLPALDPDHAMTGRPLFLERSREEFANVSEEDPRRQLLEIWEEHNELMHSCLQGKLSATFDTVYEIIAGLRPTDLEPLWQALRLGLNLPLVINQQFLQEGDLAGISGNQSVLNIPFSQRWRISLLIQGIQVASRECLSVFITMIPELEILALTLNLRILPKAADVTLESIPLEERAENVLEKLYKAQNRLNRRNGPAAAAAEGIIPTYLESHFADLLAEKSANLCHWYSLLLSHMPKDPVYIPGLYEYRAHQHSAVAWFYGLRGLQDRPAGS